MAGKSDIFTSIHCDHVYSNSACELHGESASLAGAAGCFTLCQTSMLIHGAVTPVTTAQLLL